MPGLLTKKWKCRQMVWVADRRELSMIKLSLWLTYCAMLERKERKPQ